MARINSLIGWLLTVLVFIVVLESASSYPARSEGSVVSASRPSTATRKHSSKSNSTTGINIKEAKRNNKKKRQQMQNNADEELHHHHHSSRGLKQAMDYDYALLAEPKAVPRAVQQQQRSAEMVPSKSGVKADRSPWSAKRRDKKSNRKNNKRSKKNDKKQRQVVRTARRAATFNDDDQDGTDPLLGLGVFGDMRKFFDELRSNLDVEAVAAEAAAAVSERGVTKDEQGAGLEDYEDLPNYQALRTAVGLDASLPSPVQQQQRRYSRLRGFVAMGGPGSSGESSRHHRTHPYDPALLWTGLGRRR